MGIPVLSDSALAAGLLSGEISAKRALKFLRLCPSEDRQAQVLALLPDADLPPYDAVRVAWTEALRVARG